MTNININTAEINYNSFPVIRAGESRQSYRMRVQMYSNRRADQDGMIRAARTN